MPAEATVEELRTLFLEQQYSRVPVYQDSLDNVLGFVFVKDLIHQPATSDPHAAITPLIRPAMFVPETKRVVELLRELQRNRLQVAIVVDEYGGTSGLVALEDLSYEETARVLDIPIGTVMSRLARAREKVRQWMNGKGGTKLQVVK